MAICIAIYSVDSAVTMRFKSKVDHADLASSISVYRIPRLSFALAPA